MFRFQVASDLQKKSTHVALHKDMTFAALVPSEKQEERLQKGTKSTKRIMLCKRWHM